jgi:hypothetical protein
MLVGLSIRLSQRVVVGHKVLRSVVMLQSECSNKSHHVAVGT